MLAVALVEPRRMMGVMSRPPEDSTLERKLIGQALGVLRKRAQMTQGDAADRIGATPQTWQRYEAGERQAILRSDLQERLARAVDSGREELLRERHRLAGETPEDHQAPWAREATPAFRLHVMGRVQAGPAGAQIYDAGEPIRTIDLFQLVGRNAGVLQLAGDSMLPWGEPGEIIIYDRDRYPRRGYGCVIETIAGEYYVKLYNRTQSGNLIVDQLNPPENMTFALGDIKGVYAVTLRGD